MGRLLPAAADVMRLLLLASILVSLTAAGSAPTPLYATYATRWGFSPITTTVLFGVYTIALLVALLVLGWVSDHTGRRPVLLTALVVQVIAMIVTARPPACPGRGRSGSRHG